MNLASRPVGCPLCGAMAGTRLWQRHGFDWLRCGADGMVWVSPQLTSAAVATVYAAGHAMKAAGLGAPDRPVPARYRQVLARLTELAGGPGRLLEVGAFDGLFLQAGLDAGWEAAGTEINATAAADAARRGVDMHIGPLESAPFAPHQFDAAALRDVIEHLPTPRSDLVRLANWLRPGGGLYVWTPNFDSLSRRMYGQRWGAVVFPWHFSYFTATTLRRLLAATGFRVVSLTSRNLLLGRADPWEKLAGQSGGKVAEAIGTGSATSPPIPQTLRPKGAKGSREVAESVTVTAASAGQAVPTAGRGTGRAERWLARLANPAFAVLDQVGVHWGAQLEVFAVRCEDRQCKVD